MYRTLIFFTQICINEEKTRALFILNFSRNIISRVEKYNLNVIRSSNQHFWCNNYSLFRIKMLDEILQRNIHIPNIWQQFTGIFHQAKKSYYTDEFISFRVKKLSKIPSTLQCRDVVVPFFRGPFGCRATGIFSLYKQPKISMIYYKIKL